MSFPLLEDCLEKISNRYLLVVLAAKRSRQLNRGAERRRRWRRSARSGRARRSKKSSPGRRTRSAPGRRRLPRPVPEPSLVAGSNSGWPVRAALADALRARSPARGASGLRPPGRRSFLGPAAFATSLPSWPGGGSAPRPPRVAMSLAGRELVLGVTGSIAAYKAAYLLRELRRLGASVTVVMTAHAREFVGPLTFRTLSGRPVL
ncbi:MAG: DNA-directed RNA polymerase subunit omega, partial [Candidatus Rokubacteria bacterium]|nr:DNA-directed RNA polymerase subunit omega [Candidatus Rokubacteria bacterium]